jgi:nitrite reductase/ring-hydroxylating ferredoxin subunit
MKVAVALAEPDELVVEEARPARRINLGPADRIPMGTGRKYWVEGREVAVYRDRRRQFYASQNWCPHHFGSLADGSVGYSEVSCPLHGLRFDLRSGQPKGHDCGVLRTYRVRLTRRGDLHLILPAESGVRSQTACQ